MPYVIEFILRGFTIHVYNSRRGYEDTNLLWEKNGKQARSPS